MPTEELIKWIFFSIWLTIFLVAILTEIFTTEIFSGLTAISVFPSVIIAFVWGDKLWTISIQIIFLVAIWIILYFTLYKVLKEWLDKKSKFKGSVEDYVNKEFEILEDSTEIDSKNLKYGKIKIQDKVFRVLSEKHQGEIKKGSLIIITRIEGNTFYVKRTKEK